MRNVFYVVIAFVFLIFFSCSNNLPGFDFKTFENTPVSELAKAVKNEDIEKIEKIINENKSYVDYTESAYGHSLLMLAVANNLDSSVEKLLKMGANPNLKSKPSNESEEILTPMFIACNKIYNKSNCDTNILDLLINNGGKIDDEINVSYVGANYKSIETPLMEACKHDCLPVVKKLVENGADINKYDYKEGHGPISNAIIHNQMNILKYLVIDKHIKIPEFCYVVPSHNETPRKEYTVTEFLLKQKYGKDSENYNIRKEILDYLKANEVMYYKQIDEKKKN